MVLVVVILGLVVGAGTIPLTSAIRTMHDHHALAGLLGEPKRDRVAVRQTARVLQLAERTLRLHEFRQRMDGHVWNGTLLHIRPVSGGWAVWTFADGTTWHVQHDGDVPTNLRRCVIGSVEERSASVGVGVYVPVTATTERVLEIRDAREPQNSPDFIAPGAASAR